MTTIPLIPDVPVGTRRVAVFDTNAYRNFTWGLSLEEARARSIQLRELEQGIGEMAFASPLVVWELLAHLADPTDPGYTHCLHAVVALGEHTREPHTGGIAMTMDSEWVVCHCLFGKGPDGAEANVSNLAGTACYVRDHAPSIADQTAMANLQVFSREMGTRESSWLADVQDLLNQVNLIGAHLPGQTKNKSAAQLRKLIARPQFEELWSMLGVARYAQLAGVTLDGDELEARAAFFQKEFSVPFRLITGLLSNMLNNTKAKLSNPKRKRGNFMWDAGICYMIPGASSSSVTTPMRIVTADKAIVQAAEAAQCADKVIDLTTYLKELGAPANWTTTIAGKAETT